MNDTDAQRIAALLEQMLQGQREQIARQAEALALQREQFAMVQRQCCSGTDDASNPLEDVN